MQPATLKHRDLTLRGSKYGAGGDPKVMIAHGFSDNRIGPGRLVVQLARELAATGFTVWAFDRAGHGESDGDLAEISVPDEIDQLSAMLDLIAGRAHVIGHSLGGMEAATLAGRLPERIASLTLLAPAAASVDDVRRGEALGRSIAPLERGEPLDIDGQALGRAFVDGMAGYDPYAGIEAFTGPVFVHHGLADEVVDPAYSRRYADTFPGARLTTYPDADHGWTALASRRTLIANCVGELQSLR